ncbi:MAG: bis(5'-nucleosyl)-tetraphosphatase [Spirochaetaceae bacterium]
MGTDERAAGAVVVRKTGFGEWECVLVLQHNGDWGLPKGHVEAGESDAETAIREVREETGLSITPAEGFAESVVYTLPSGKTKEVVYFLAHVKAGQLTPQPEEIRDTRWFRLDDAFRTVRYPSVRGVIAAARRALERA